VLLGGCGSHKEGKPIPRAQVAELEKQLGSIERRLRYGDGACGDIQDDNLPSVRRLVDALPHNVDADVRDALSQSFDRLFQLTSDQCDAAKNQRTTPETTPQPAPLPPTPTTTTTQPETTTGPSPETTPKPEKPGKGKGKANGKGKGKGQQGDGSDSTGGSPVP
jgi:hypothetical protein